MQSSDDDGKGRVMKKNIWSDQVCASVEDAGRCPACCTCIASNQLYKAIIFVFSIKQNL